MPNNDASQVRVAGTGELWKAPTGTPIPTDSTTAWNAAFVALGYATNGFTITQDLKTTPIPAWQTLEPIRMINTGLTRKINFESLESDRQNLGLAWGGATLTNTGVATGGAVTFATGTITTATAHSLAVGNPIQFTSVTGSPGVVTGTTYYVLSVPTATTMTVSASSGGSLIAITAGTATGVIPAGPYSLSIPDAALTQEFILGVDWSDGTSTQRLILQRATLLSLPTLKYVRDDVVRYPVELQALKPFDGSNSIIIYGNDQAATS